MKFVKESKKSKKMSLPLKNAAIAAIRSQTSKLELLAKFVEGSVEETLPYMDFPTEHWRKIRTNNGLERIMKEIIRRTRVVGSFPDGYFAMMLVGITSGKLRTF